MKIRFNAVMTVGCLLLAGCANHPLLHTAQASSTDSVNAISRELSTDQKVEKAASTPGYRVPQEVTQALLPPLNKPAPTPSEARFDVNAKDLPAQTFFQSLVQGTGYNVVVHPAVKGNISLQLKRVTLPEVMSVVSQLYGYDIQHEGNLYKVLPGGLQTHIFHINYLYFKRKGGSEIQVSAGQVTSVDNGNSNSGNTSGNSNSGQNNTNNRVIGTRITTETESDFWGDLNKSVKMIVGDGKGRQVITNADAGLLVVRAMPDEIHSVEDYLQRTQLIIQRQVILEAKILEVRLNKSYQQGIDWTHFQDLSASLAADGNKKSYLQTAVGGKAIASNEIGGVFSASLRISDFTALIQLLGEQGNVQVLSSPRISTVNNQKAVIKVGTDEFFVTNIDFNNQNNVNTTSNTTTSVQLTPFFSGISLDVTPEISQNGTIILHVHPSVSNVTDQQKVVTIGDKDVTLPLALSTVRETDSIIKARNGQIVVIGGLIQNQSQDNNASVPFFSDIPVIGELFKQKRFQSTKSELVILLRPVVTDNQVWDQDLSRSRQRFNALRDTLQSYPSPAPMFAQ